MNPTQKSVQIAAKLAQAVDIQLENADLQAEGFGVSEFQTETDSDSNPFRTVFRDMRTVVEAKRRVP